MTFREWFYSALHRAKYTEDHPAYLAAQEAWEASHEECADICDQHASVEGIAQRCAEQIRGRGKI